MRKVTARLGALCFATGIAVAQPATSRYRGDSRSVEARRAGYGHGGTKEKEGAI
jgi:hypothetical protein